ncbi:MAG: cardiolipin synthase [Pseudomonadota bacterium]
MHATHLSTPGDTSRAHFPLPHNALKHRLHNAAERFFLLLAFSFVLFLPACATLPDVQYLNTSLSPNLTPTVTTAHGTLSAKKTSALLAKRWLKAPIDINALATLEEAATGTPLIAGNKVVLLFDGPQTILSMIDAITQAHDHINLETYIFDQDPLGQRFSDLLIAKQKEGVQVRIIYDSVGTIGTPATFFDRMRDAGIQLVAFNPINPFARVGRWRINNRDHRKILIVDGKVAFAGGVNISNTYSNGSLFRSGKKNEDKIGWRDTHLKIEGPAVASFQWIFLDTWLKQSKEDLADRNLFPQLTPTGDEIVRVLASEPKGDYAIYKAYILAIQQAQKSIHITSAYFVPDSQSIDALCKAAQRGVDVQIILPGVSDSSLVIHAGRSFYTQLLESGVKLFELQISVLHAKTAVIDGVWSTVGSTNIDTRSFMHNNEINLIVLGEPFGQEMENAFKEDLRDSKQIDIEQWVKRPNIDRIKEWFARSMGYWL